MNGIRSLPPPGMFRRRVNTPGRPAATQHGPGFAQVLREEVAEGAGLRFSAHARQRLHEREIRLTPEELHRLEDAVRALAMKGGREALLVTEKASLVVSVRNSTVITALGSGELDRHIFTNIDSAVVIPSADSTSDSTT